MKIGILIDRLNIGGVEKIAIEEVKSLRAIGEEAYLVVLRQKAVVDNAFPELLKDIPIIYLDQRLLGIFRLSFRFPVFHFFSFFHITYPILLPFVIKKHEFDYIIAHGTYTCLSAVAIKKRNKIPFSAFIWDPSSYILERVYSEGVLAPVINILKHLATLLDGYIINNMDRVLVGGNAHDNFIARINPDKIIETIYPSVHPINKQSKKDDYALVVTAWKKGKNPEYLFEIAKNLPNLHIKMAGKWIDPEYKDDFEKQLKNNGLEKQIEVIGEVSESKLSSLYAHALVLLQTNDDRGFGLPAIEAASKGTTFIIPEGQGVCDLFTNEVDGYYTKERDTKTIVLLLRKLMNDKKLSKEMGQCALAKVIDNYSWKIHAQTIENTIKDILDTKRKTVHILFTGLVSSKMLSGGDQLILDIVPRLPKDIKIIVITPHFAKNHWDGIDKNNVEFLFLKKSIFDQKTNPIFVFASYAVRSYQVYKLLKKEAVQTIYSCSDIAYADIWPAYFFVKRHPNVKWLSRIYHVLLDPKKRQGSSLANTAAYKLQQLSFMMIKKESSTIFALNPSLYKELIGLGLPKNKLTVLGAGIDFDAINAYVPNKKYNYDVVALGRVAPVKGIYDTVKIWKTIHSKKPDLKLAWIGGGDAYYEKVIKMIKADSLSDSFHLLGFIEKNEVYNVLKSAKVFICPDHEIGWGLAVCEAMACNLPVVSYNNEVFGGIYKKGFRSSPLFDTDSFAKEVIIMIDNEKTRLKTSEDATNQARVYDHKRVIDKLIKYL